MLSKKLKNGLLAITVGVSIFACEKPVDIIEKASLTQDHRSFLKSYGLSDVEEAAALLKTGYAKRNMEWEGTSYTLNKPFTNRPPLEALPPLELIELAEKALAAKDFSLTENENAFISVYLYSLSLDSISVLSSGLPRKTINKSLALANSYHEKLTSEKNIKLSSIYKALASKGTDWFSVMELTKDDEAFALLHKKSIIMSSVTQLSGEIQSSMSVNSFQQFIKEYEDTIFSPDMGSVLPDIVYLLVTNPYNRNKDVKPRETDQYLTYVMIQDLPLLSEIAKALKGKIQKSQNT